MFSINASDALESWDEDVDVPHYEALGIRNRLE